MQKKNFKIAGDLMYTVLATVVMNIALQLIIYPLITHFHGDIVTGEILYFIGFIYIIPQALGSALSSARLVIRKTHDASNSDFTLMTVIFSVISALICGFIGFSDTSSPNFAIWYGIFSVIYLIRMYAQVEFRLALKFKEHFLYYCIISVGYLVGLGLYFLFNNWLLIFIVGELSALAYSFFKGEILKKDLRKAPLSAINKTVLFIVLSLLMRDCVIHFDKVILKQTISATVVTQYHVVSLIAKTLQMLIQPINTLIMSYLTVKDATFSRKMLTKFTSVSLVLGVVFYVGCLIGTPIYIKLFYSSLYSEIIRFSPIVNLGLILGFIASLFMAVILSQGKTRLHTAIECIWGICYIAAAYQFSSAYGIWGMAYTTLVMNTIKMIIAIALLYSTSQKTISE